MKTFYISQKCVRTRRKSITNIFQDLPSEYLMIDDKQSSCFRIAKYLQKSDKGLDFANNKIKALRLLKAYQYKSVLCELNMVDFSGYELISEYRSWEAENNVERKYIIAFTILSENEIDFGKLKTCGFDKYVSKSISRSFLLDILNVPS